MAPLERPGVVPDDSEPQEWAIEQRGASSDPDQDRPAEVITEVAPEIGPAESEPERYGEEPAEVITEVAPEIGPAESEPAESEPAEVITEVAPEIGPAESEPESYGESGYLAEIAPGREDEDPGR